jgi:hypothetical protein
MKAYMPQTFDHLNGLDGISDAQLAEHFKLYEGYVKQVNSLNEQLDEMCERASRRAPTRTSPSSRGISASSTTA